MIEYADLGRSRSLDSNESFQRFMMASEKAGTYQGKIDNDLRRRRLELESAKVAK